MENNPKMAILSFKTKKNKKNTYFELLRSRTRNTIAHKSLEKVPKALFQEISWLKLYPINVPPPPQYAKTDCFCRVHPHSLNSQIEP